MSTITDAGTDVTLGGTADATEPARGSLRALLHALAGHRFMMVRTCAAALV